MDKENQSSIVIKLAKAICKAEGKNPNKMYKGKPLWQYSIDFAKALALELPEFSKKKEEIKQSRISPLQYDEKIKNGVQCYIEIFNDGTPKSLGRYEHVNNMKSDALDLHMRSLKAAINGMIK